MDTTSRSTSDSSSGSASSEGKPKKLAVSSMSDLSRASLSRLMLSKFVHAPFFKNTVVGCFVRIGIGENNGKCVYRIAQIGLLIVECFILLFALVGVTETAKTYQLEGTRTNKGLKLKFGTDERIYRIEFISNGNFSESEFHHWLNTMNSARQSLPTIDFIGLKENQITNSLNHKYNGKELDEMLKEKSRFVKIMNVAQKKSVLMKDKQFAVESGEDAKANALQKEIDALEAQAKPMPQVVEQSRFLIAIANQRKAAAVDSKPSVMPPPDLKQVKQEIDPAYDPFTRKNGRNKVVCRTAKSKPVAAPIKKIVKRQSKIFDLFRAHDVEVDFQLKIPENISTTMPDIDMEEENMK